MTVTPSPQSVVVPDSRDDAVRKAVFGQVDLATAELELNGSLYDGFAAAIMVKGQPRTIALTREYSDAVQLMAIIQRDRATLPMILDLHRSGVLSEGQVSAATGLDRVEIRSCVDALAAAPAPSSLAGGEVREAVHEWLREDASLASKMNMTPDVVDRLVTRLAALSPEAPAREGE